MKIQRLLSEDLIKTLTNIYPNTDWESKLLELHNSGFSKTEISKMLEDEYGIQNSFFQVNYFINKHTSNDEQKTSYSDKEIETTFNKMLHSETFDSLISEESIISSSRTELEKIILLLFIKLKENTKLGNEKLSEYIKSQVPSKKRFSDTRVAKLKNLFNEHNLISETQSDSNRIPRLVLVVALDVLYDNGIVGKGAFNTASILKSYFKDIIPQSADTIRKNLGKYGNNPVSIVDLVADKKTFPEIFKLLIEETPDVKGHFRTWFTSNKETLSTSTNKFIVELYDKLKTSPYIEVLHDLFADKYDVVDEDNILINVYFNKLTNIRTWDITPDSLIPFRPEVSPCFVKQFKNIREAYTFIQYVYDTLKTKSLWECELLYGKEILNTLKQSEILKNVTNGTNFYSFKQDVKQLLESGTNYKILNGYMFSIELGKENSLPTVSYSKGLSRKQLLYRFAVWINSQNIPNNIEEKYKDIITEAEKKFIHGKIIKENIDIKEILKHHYDEFGNVIKSDKFIGNIAVDSDVYMFKSVADFEDVVRNTQDLYGNTPIVYAYIKGNEILYVGVTLNWKQRGKEYLGQINGYDQTSTEQKISTYLKTTLNSNSELGWVCIKKHYPALLDVYKSAVLPIEKYLISKLQLRSKGYNVDVGGKNASRLQSNYNRTVFVNILNKHKKVLSEEEFISTWKSISNSTSINACPYKYKNYFVVKSFDITGKLPEKTLNVKLIQSKYLNFITKGDSAADKIVKIQKLNKLLRSKNQSVFQQLDDIDDDLSL